MTFDGVSPMADLRKANGHEEPWTVDYFGVGNENWGCGGNMTPEYYGNLYRRFQTYVRQYSKENKVEIEKDGENFNITMHVADGSKDFMVLKLNVPSIEEAELIKDKFLDDPVKIYNNLINSIFS